MALFQSRDPAMHHENTAEWANEVGRHHTRHSIQSRESGTLLEPGSPASADFADEPAESLSSRWYSIRNAGKFAFAIAKRALVLAGFGQVLSEIVVYTGGCRGSLVNSCLAHLISKLN